MTGRRMTNRVQGGDDGWMIQGEDRRSQGGPHRGRSQGGERRDSEQEDSGGTQAIAMKVTHGRADGGMNLGGGRADNSRGSTDGGRSRWWWSPRRR